MHHELGQITDSLETISGQYGREHPCLSGGRRAMPRMGLSGPGGTICLSQGLSAAAQQERARPQHSVRNPHVSPG